MERSKMRRATRRLAQIRAKWQQQVSAQ